MKRIVPVVGLVVLILLLVFVNRSINSTAHPDTDEDAPAQETQKSSPKPPASPVADQAVDLAAEISIGDPAKSQHKITVGWIYDDTNQPHPQALADAIQAVQKIAQSSGGSISGEIVDMDVPAGDLTPLASSVNDLGVFLDGAPVGPTVNPGTNGVTADFLSRSLPK